MNKLTETAPQRIFLQVSDEDGDEDCVFSDLQRDGAEVTWCDASMVCCEVRYVRADIHAALRAETARLLIALQWIVERCDKGGAAIIPSIRAAASTAVFQTAAEPPSE